MEVLEEVMVGLAPPAFHGRLRDTVRAVWRCICPFLKWRLTMVHMAAGERPLPTRDPGTDGPPDESA